jgi:hypothetical protein
MPGPSAADPEGVSTMADPAPEPDRLFKRLRLPAALLLLVLLVFGAYYALQYHTSSDYLASRNFRLLGTLGRQVREAVRNEGKVFTNVVGEADHPSGAAPLAPGAEKASGAASLDPGTLSPPIRVHGSCPEPQGPPSDPDLAEKGKPSLWRTLNSYDGTYRLAFQSRKDEGPPLCGDVELKGLLDPLFSSRQAFDAVLLANGEGKVVYLYSPKGLQVEQLDLLIQHPHDTKTATAAGKNRSFEAYQGYSDSVEVELEGRIYTAFVQPFSLSLAAVTNEPAGKADEKAAAKSRDVWLLAGLVANDEMAAKNLALSPSLVAFLLGILVLAALSWPLVKLKMLGERQRVKKMDVLLVGLCSLLGVSVATLFVLDMGAYQILKSSSEIQLHNFAEQMESNLLVEIRLAYDQLRSLEQSPKSLPQQGYLTADDDLHFYPHFESFALIDATGKQVYKRAMPGNTPQPIRVAERLYFERAYQGPTLTVPEPKKEAARGLEPFFLESVQSWTNGKWQGVIAKPSEPNIEPLASHDPHVPPGPPPQVAALAIQMLSVVNPILPPEFEFAVVGDDGTVLFHSDSARNRSENFFDETDQDRRFRSLVLARHDEALNLHYWGESYKAFAIPVKGLPWTIVAMRKAKVLERVNLDWLVTTLILILVYMSVIAVALLAAALLRPKSLVTWIWPDSDRPQSYAKLLVLLGIFCLAFLIALFALRGTGYLFAVAALLSALSLAVAYLMLSPVEQRTASRGVVEGCGVVLLALLARALYLALPESGVRSWVPWLVLALAAGACLLAVDGPKRWRDLEWENVLPVSRSYPLLGLLLILLVSVLPTVGFFKVAHRLQMNSFVRNGQLKMAKLLVERSDAGGKKPAASLAPRSASLAVTRDLTKSLPSLDFYGRAFFDTALHPGPHPHPEVCAAHEKEDDEPLALLLPPYSDYTAESRELSRGRPSDDDWSWCEAYGKTFFDGDNYLRISLVSTIDPVWRGNGPFLAMAGLLQPHPARDLVADTDREPVERSTLDPIDPAAAGETGRILLQQGMRVILTGCVLALFGTLLYALVTFVARRIFLLDIEKPLWVKGSGDLPALVGANVFLISRTQSWGIPENAGFVPLSFRDLDRNANDWSDLRSKLFRDADSNVLVDGFEYRAFDPEWNARKLRLLEELVFVHQRVVVVLSELSPSVVFSPLGSAKDPDEERWRTLLGSFIQIHRDVWPASNPPMAAAKPRRSVLSKLGRPFSRRPRQESPTPVATPDAGLHSPLLRLECGEDVFLKRIGGALDKTATRYNREQLLEELGERAQGYYSALWASCSRDERVVLGHLAEEGLVNAKNRRTVRRLMARRLIHRAPNLRLMNETFRRFVVSPACREQVLDLEQAAGRSPWDRFHWPFSAALAAGAALILITQQELLDSTVATVTGVTAGLPTLLKVIDLLGWKRGGKAA